MTDPDDTREWGWRDALAAWALFVASSYGCLAYVGRPLAWPGSPVPFLAFSVLVVGAAWALLSARARRLPRWSLWAGLAAVSVALVGWYARYEPSHAPYADNADALRLGVLQLLHGRSPYAVHTFLDGPITPMLGGFLLAAPFVVLGGSLFAQQIVWLLGAAAVWARAAGPRAALAAVALFAASPWARMALPYQSDTWISALGVAISGSLGWWALERRRTGGAWWWATSALFGVALAYRFIFWIAVIPLGVALVRRFGWRRALAWLTPAGIVTVALAVAPVFFDLPGYREGPIGTGLSKANHDAVAGASIIVALMTLLVVGLGAWRARTLRNVWAATSAGLAAMVATVCATKLPALGASAFSTYDTLAYNGAFLVLGLLALTWPRESVDARSVPGSLAAADNNAR